MTRSGNWAALVFTVTLAGCGLASEASTDAPRAAVPATIAVAAPPAAASCGARPAREVKLSRDVEPILMSGCSGEFCHRLTSSARAYAFLVDQPSVECDDGRLLVTPGNPGRSYVVDKILDRNLCAGHPMPRGFENRLSAEEIQTVTDWICEGAPND